MPEWDAARATERAVRSASSAFVALLIGCTGPQSALDPAGGEAAELTGLFWRMTIGAGIVWTAFVALAIYAVYFARRPKSERLGRRLIVVGGVVLPTFVLGALLVDGLAALPRFLEPAPEGSLRIRVRGEQWWWRVQYLPDGREPIELANELRLPAGEPVDFELESQDVIHSFWIPALGGKMDMIPGRTTRLRLKPVRPGVYRGVCAEYCGTAHAFMAFAVVVHEPGDFAAWLAAEERPARVPDGALAQAGHASFLRNGCGACHTVRGTRADGAIGPDLTHLGGRRSLGAGLLANDRAAIHDWIARTSELKPGVHMPAFGMLPKSELEGLAAYLEGLK